MDKSKLIVFYSRTGMTRKVARKLADILDADVEELMEVKNRSGVKGYLSAGRDAFRRRIVEIKKTEKDPGLYNFVIIGTPIWAFTMCCAVRTYLRQNKGKFKELAFFCTEGGSGGKRAFSEMKSICDKKPSGVLEINAKDLKSEGWLRKVAEFVREIKVHLSI